MESKRARRRKHPATIHLTIAERDLLLAHGAPTTGFAERFATARLHGPLVTIGLDDRELTEFLFAFEDTANSAQNIEAADQLLCALARIEAGLSGEADPGAHMLRPAVSRLDMSWMQGQYLAFIHAYTRVHRRAPAESDIQEYFRTTPPSVHEMLKTLVRKKFIRRSDGVARSTRVLLSPHEIPELE